MLAPQTTPESHVKILNVVAQVCNPTYTELQEAHGAQAQK